MIVFRLYFLYVYNMYQFCKTLKEKYRNIVTKSQHISIETHGNISMPFNFYFVLKSKFKAKMLNPEVKKLL